MNGVDAGKTRVGRGLLALLRPRRDLQPLHLLPQVLAADAQVGGRVRDLALAALQRLLDVAALAFADVLVQGAGGLGLRQFALRPVVEQGFGRDGAAAAGQAQDARPALRRGPGSMKGPGWMPLDCLCPVAARRPWPKRRADRCPNGCGAGARGAEPL
jgi:hypothetical protein